MRIEDVIAKVEVLELKPGQMLVLTVLRTVRPQVSMALATRLRLALPTKPKVIVVDDDVRVQVVEEN